MHWPLDNSARAQGSEEHIMAVFSATLFAAAPALRLTLGYLLGLTGSVAGLWLSYAADLPTGTTMMAVLGLLPLLALTLRPSSAQQQPRRLCVNRANCLSRACRCSAKPGAIFTLWRGE